MLLDNQSTIYLICNKKFTSKIKKSREKLRLQSNGGKLVVNQQSDMPGYKIKTWFGNKAITNIVWLKIIIKQYRGKIWYYQKWCFECINWDYIYITRRNMEKQIWYLLLLWERIWKRSPRSTSKEQKGQSGFIPSWFTHQIRISDGWYRTLTSRILIRRFEILMYPKKIWGKNIDSLKGKTVRSKPNVVAEDRIKIQIELQKIKKTVFLTAGLFFVNGIPFLFLSAAGLTLQP